MSVVQDGKHTCGAPGCEVVVSRGMLMCHTHWAMLPAPVRHQVNLTWRRFRDDPTTGREYRAARAAAVAYFKPDEG